MVSWRFHVHLELLHDMAAYTCTLVVIIMSLKFLACLEIWDEMVVDTSTLGSDHGVMEGPCTLGTLE